MTSLNSNEEVNTNAEDPLRERLISESAQLDRDTEEQNPPKIQDNRLRAVIAMNVFCLLRTAVSISFKYLVAEGVNVLEFTVARNIMLLLVCIPLVRYYEQVPWRVFPKKWVPILFVRMTSGQLGFTLMAVCVSLIPLSLVMVLFQTSPFWAAGLAYFINKE